MSAQYRCVVIEVDPEFLRVELDALFSHLAEMGLPPVAVFDPQISSYCPSCRQAHYLSECHPCPTATLTG